MRSGQDDSGLFIKCQHPDSWEDYRHSGRITAEVLRLMQQEAKPGKTPQELNVIAEKLFESRGVTPVFKGYRGFPAAVCISVNRELVHGIPKNNPLCEGDMVSFDTGCKYKGTITDSAVTCLVGEGSLENQKIIDATKECLMTAISRVRIGGRTGDLGDAIFHTARKKGYKVIEQYTGHGISLERVHSDPPILNKSNKDTGIRIQAGMIFAIEPLLLPNTASTKTHVSSDGWTVVAEDRCAHFEHSVLVTNNGIEILTL